MTQLSISTLGIFLFIYFLAAVVSIPIWRELGTKFGLVNSWMVAMFILIITFLSGLHLNQGDFIFYSLICLLTGFTLGAELIFPSSILALLVDNPTQAHLATGYFSITDFITKSSLALASVVLFPLLESSGFTVVADNSTVTLKILLLTYILVPCGLKLLALLLTVIWKTTMRVTL